MCSLALDVSVDFCDKAECRATATEIDDTTHLPTHDVIKLRRPTLLYHDLPHLFRLAKDTLKQAQNIFRKSATTSTGIRRSRQEDDHVEGDRHISVRKRLSAEDLDADALSEAGSAGSWAGTETGDDASRTSSRSVGSKRIRSRRKRLAPVPSCASCQREVCWPCLVCVECEGKRIPSSLVPGCTRAREAHMIFLQIQRPSSSARTVMRSPMGCPRATTYPLIRWYDARRPRPWRRAGRQAWWRSDCARCSTRKPQHNQSRSPRSTRGCRR